MAKLHHISFYANDQEMSVFNQIKEALERTSNSDTIRAMMRFCKKNLPQNIDVSVSPRIQ